MDTKGKTGHRNLIVVASAVLVMLTALLFCLFLLRGINRRMNESATSNLLNTTRVMESTLEQLIDHDFDSLRMVGQRYQNGEPLSAMEMDALCSAMGFERVRVVDAAGNGADGLGDGFRAQQHPCYQEWVPEQQGYSDAYFGQSGRLQTTLWLPVYRGETYIGTVIGDVVISKYYSANVFTFYEGEGRTYLFDGSDGAWILKSLGTDGSVRRQDDIYALLRESGNDEGELQAFRQAIENRQTGTAVFRFNEKESYICFMPLSSSRDWYLATVIANDVLLKESAQVQQTIQLALAIVCVALLFFTITLAAWQTRRTMERETAYREALFLNVSSNIDSAFLIFEESSGEMVFVSENVGRLLDLDREWLQADARHLFDWCGIPEDDPQRVAFLTGTMETPVVREAQLAGMLGTMERYIRLELIPADLGQEIIVLTDITKDKDIQRSLLEAMQRAEEASHAKNDFLSAMSHDIRTPMNGIVGMTAIAAAHLEEPNRVRDCLSKINEASAHLLTIINEILDMSQIESGQMTLTADPFNVAEPLQEVMNLCYSGIQQKNHTVHVHVHSMEHEQVIGDAARLRRIVINLVSNAVKYTPEGGTIWLDLRERPSVIQGYGCYELQVRDTGIGMSPEFQKKLFQPFEREEDVRISRVQGTGLGMAIVKNIVTLMMGDIQVESEKHKGSTVRVTVNLRLGEEREARDGVLDSLPVLVVDDDLFTCETVAGMLCDIGMVGEWVDNGAQAVEKVAERHRRREDYLAILLDWKMPGMDGVETARRIRAEVDPSVPIIILTAYDWSEIESEARAAGVNAFMSKPIYKAKLWSTMTELAAGPAQVSDMQERDLPPGKRVLLVEDNELNQEIATELLQMLGLTVDVAENGAVAVERFKSAPSGTYDLIFMDIQMPVMNGYEAAAAIRSVEGPGSEVPIIAMTADTFTQDIQVAYGAGMNEHIAKPISVARLREVLTKFLVAPDQETGGREGASIEQGTAE